MIAEDFTFILKVGIHNIMPLRTVRIHTAPWMTAHLKDLINCCQKALAQGNQASSKFYRSRVKKESKSCRANYLILRNTRARIQDYGGSDVNIYVV